MPNPDANNYTSIEEQSILQAIADLTAAINARTTALSIDDRMRYGSVNEKNKLVVNKALDILQQGNPLFANIVNTPQFEATHHARQFLELCVSRLQTAIRILSDKKILNDYANYQDTLAIYDYSQLLAKRGIPDAATAVEEMRQFFSRTTKSETPTTPTTPDNQDS